MIWSIAIACLFMCIGGANAAPPQPLVGDYDAELRRDDGEHVDCPLMLERLQKLNANTYMWLMWHNANDWQDLHEFLPLARDAGIDVWAYLVPHSETPFQSPKWPYSEPFRLDYVKWAEEIARLSLEHDNLVGYVIDDFWVNFTAGNFTEDYVREMVQAGKDVNPDIKFYPLMYYRQFGPAFADGLAPLIDGAVAAYPKARAEIQTALDYLNDDYALAGRAIISLPSDQPTSPANGAFISQTAAVQDAADARVTFQYRDTYDGPTHGYHLMQVRVDDETVWQEDTAERDDSEVTVDLSKATADKDQVTLRFGVFDEKGVSNYPVKVAFADLSVTGLELQGAEFGVPAGWETEIDGPFSIEHAPAKEGERGFKLPLIIMTAGSRGAYKKRNGEEATPERIAAKVAMALEFVADGRAQGVVTYCLDKTPDSADLEAVAQTFAEFLRQQTQTKQ